jgi:hypothetical protein
MRPHARAKDSVDARLVSALTSKPAQQVGIEAHRRDFFRSGHHELPRFPELFVGGVRDGVQGDKLRPAAG